MCGLVYCVALKMTCGLIQTSMQLIFFFSFTSGDYNSGLLKEYDGLLVIKTILYPKDEACFISDLIYPFYNT